jgi:putative hydrolase of the HAD superfamily
MLPDASACLQKLRGRAVLGLISDGPLASQQAKSRKLGLYDLFQSVILTDQWGSQYCKPHLRAFQFFQDQVRSKQGRFVYVADNPAKDFSAPLALGWETVRVRRPDGLHFLKQAVPAAQPGFEIGDLSKLCSVLHVDCP